MALIIYLIVGGIAGWLMAVYLKEHGTSLYTDIAVGVLGGLIGGWIIGEIGLGGIVGAIIGAAIGGVGLVFGIRAAQRAVAQQSAT
jgi:uncharacterized membrane protein YeaQ/YmgE (transglycosylase-associated protein family)